MHHFSLKWTIYVSQIPKRRRLTDSEVLLIQSTNVSTRVRVSAVAIMQMRPTTYVEFHDTTLQHDTSPGVPVISCVGLIYDDIIIIDVKMIVPAFRMHMATHIHRFHGNLCCPVDF